MNQCRKAIGIRLGQLRIGVCVLWLAIAMMFVGTASAQQFDAPYYELKKKRAAEWVEEDKAIDAKLSALEK